MGKIRKLGRGTVWETGRIRKEQESIRAELDRHTKAEDPRSRLDYALTRIQELDGSDTPLDRLRQYIYVVSAMVHNERIQGSAPMERLFEKGMALLKVSGVRSGRSRLGFLYGDLYQAASQASRRLGDPWLSAWQQHFSVYSTQMSQRRKSGVPQLALAVRSLRLGDARTAVDLFERAEIEGLSERSIARARVEKAKALRLSGDISSAERVVSEAEQLSFLNPEERRELKWEKFCAIAQSTGDLEPMALSCLPGKSHHLYVYLLEAFFWMRAIKSRKWIERFPRLGSFNPGGTENPRKAYGHWYHCVRVAEKLYDQEIPFEVRLEELGQHLATPEKFFSIDKVLLFWAVSLRWLSRNRSEGFGTLVENEYRALSLRLTQGRSSDTLCLLSDILEVSNLKKAA